MIYDTTNQFQLNQMLDKIKLYISKGKTIDLKVKQPKRSISQNSYLHLILSWFAVETGYTLEEVKQDIYKKHVNQNLFYEGEATGKIEGIVIERWRSTSSLSKEEMTLSIDRFRNFSSIELGIYLPEPTDLVALQEIERELSKQTNQEFL
jgi:hypothetical protein